MVYKKLIDCLMFYIKEVYYIRLYKISYYHEINSTTINSTNIKCFFEK